MNVPPTSTPSTSPPSPRPARDLEPERHVDAEHRAALALQRGEAVLALPDVPPATLAEHGVVGEIAPAALRAGALDGRALDGEIRLLGAGKCVHESPRGCRCRRCGGLRAPAIRRHCPTTPEYCRTTLRRASRGVNRPPVRRANRVERRRAAVDRHDLARQERCLVAEQEGDHGSDLLGRAGAPKRCDQRPLRRARPLRAPRRRAGSAGRSARSRVRRR